MKVSDHFNDHLMKRIKNEKSKLRLNPIPNQKRFLGFSPLYASLMTGLTIAFFIVSLQLFAPDKETSTSQNRFYANNPEPTLSSPKIAKSNPKSQELAEAEEDSLDRKSTKSPKKDYTKQIQLVKD